MKSASAAIAAVTLLAFIMPAGAQTTAASPNSKAAASTAGAVKTPKQLRTAKSLECSKQADTKNFHGKERRKFMSSCKKA
jgi:hypothetical protein